MRKVKVITPRRGSRLVREEAYAMESCRRLKLPLRDYFSTILPGLADLPIRCLPDLKPAVRVARHS
jgi:hypothetical protein